MKRLLGLLPDPLLILLLATIGAATLWPADGRVADMVSSVATLAIVLLFFLHGVRLPRENLAAAARNWRLHLAILAATFIVFPLLGLGLALAFPNVLRAELWIGILFLCALPSTVQSSVIFTSIGQGNVAGSVTSAAASNLLGIAATPFIIGLMTHAQADAVSFSAVWKIVLQLLLPFGVGHACRPWLGAWAARNKQLLTITDRGTIVLAVYSAFSAAVIGGIWHQIPIADLLVLTGLCLLLLGAMLLITRTTARASGLDTADEVSAIMCGTQKSLVTGVPMARVLFAPADVGMVILPVMIYHQAQLIACAWLARRYAAKQPEPSYARPVDNH